MRKEDSGSHTWKHTTRPHNYNSWWAGTVWKVVGGYTDYIQKTLHADARQNNHTTLTAWVGFVWCSVVPTFSLLSDNAIVGPPWVSTQTENLMRCRNLGDATRWATYTGMDVCSQGFKQETSFK